ncbi:cell division cycle protein 23 homolog [Ctenocephalides felis]|uniref:cell division cycle protein 23 homolog n=1 Tax=Ctenocephalides felis TaxID=7515 RepID=UPI000E6E54C5|nr:cell division cycle protein 23 homolog [Ctenocephalides felis]
MTEYIERIDLKIVKSELQSAIYECFDRGLEQNAKWLADLNFGLSSVPLDDVENSKPVKHDDRAAYILGRMYFQCQEYDRAANILEPCTDEKARFLYYYSKYTSAEKKKIDNLNEPTVSSAYNNNIHKELYNMLKLERETNSLDGYCLYLYGIVLKKMQLNSLAVDILMESLTLVPTLWGAWLELAPLITNRLQLNSLQLPSHWMVPFFLIRVHLELIQNEEAIELLSALQRSGFDKCNEVLAQLAVANHNLRDVDKALEIFKKLRNDDPYRLDSIDIYSNVLYVKGLRTELAQLAHAAVDIDKYRVETCCIVANYYSIRQEHQKAILYFQRALRLNPHFLSAWTLMGHEFLELKNINAAIHCYRSAIEVNKRDFRAWYGLGQTYDILKMPFYCLYYYKQAQQLMPNDSRMLTALGEAYERLELYQNALKCYYKAHNVGDIEGMALLKSAKLYEKLGERDSAAAAYTEFCLDEFRPDNVDLHSAHKFLATYHASINQFEKASHYAFKCLDHDDNKNEAKALLKMIAFKRTEQNDTGKIPESGTITESINMDESEVNENTPSGV